MATLDVVVAAFAGYATPPGIQQRENKRRDRRARIEARYPDRDRLTKHPAMMSSVLAPATHVAAGTAV